MTTFQNFNLPPFLLQSLERIKITIPSPIQTKAIPMAMKGHDLLASSQTGSGKTIAYLLPMITTLNTAQGRTALILTPTRELAIQVKDSLIQLMGKTPSLKLAF
jgi:superfamily II DNA/RNA helicase